MEIGAIVIDFGAMNIQSGAIKAHFGANIAHSGAMNPELGHGTRPFVPPSTHLTITFIPNLFEM